MLIPPLRTCSPADEGGQQPGRTLGHSLQQSQQGPFGMGLHRIFTTQQMMDRHDELSLQRSHSLPTNQTEKSGRRARDRAFSKANRRQQPPTSFWADVSPMRSPAESVFFAYAKCNTAIVGRGSAVKKSLVERATPFAGFLVSPSHLKIPLAGPLLLPFLWTTHGYATKATTVFFVCQSRSRHTRSETVLRAGFTVGEHFAVLGYRCY